MVNFLADQVFHFESSWLCAGIPRHHFRACAWIEDKKNRWFSTSSFIARLFFSPHLHHLNYMPKKYTSTLQNTSSTPFPVQAGGIASALFTVWFSHFHSSELWWHEGSICVTKDWTKEDSWSSEGTMQNFPTKPDLNISRLTQEKKCPFQWYFERNDALGRLRKKYLHACPPRIISYLWHKHQ